MMPSRTLSWCSRGGGAALSMLAIRHTKSHGIWPLASFLFDQNFAIITTMSTKPPSRDLDKIIVRLPDGLRQRLADKAKENGRSVNAEVVHAIVKTLDFEKLTFRKAASDMK